MNSDSKRNNLTDVLASIKGSLGIDSTYSHWVNGHSLPYLTYIGSGQNQMEADSTIYWRQDTYQVELYFKKKNPDLEEGIENAFLEGGYLFDKSEDSYLDDEGVFVIFYELS